jgi:biopolymer transport protein ExbD
MLVLLVMLIITIPLQMHAVNVEMPKGAEQTQTEPPKPVIIDIKPKNQIFWDNKPVIDQSSLEALMRSEAQKTEQLEIHFKPDRLASYEDVARVMASAQRLGLVKIGIANSNEYAPTPVRISKP